MSLTRLAPTPSGMLHAGNVRNFSIVADLARDEGLTLALRIDDADAARYRRQYVDDIFRVLHSLEIDWQVGPRDTIDFEANWSQQRKTEYYRDELRLATTLHTYACTCSRAVIASTPTGGCPGGCMSGHEGRLSGAHAIRVHVPIGTTVRVSDVEVDLATAMGDFVIWRRDDLPSYQLVSVIEDRDLGTTHIVRGQDLLVSTAAQIFISESLGAANVAAATYIHHPLVVDDHGNKLSKSQTTTSGLHI